MGSDGTTVGNFWSRCKTRQYCAKTPYSRLLDNPVLSEAYRLYQLPKHRNKDPSGNAVQRQVDSLRSELNTTQESNNKLTKAAQQHKQTEDELRQQVQLLKKHQSEMVERLMHQPSMNAPNYMYRFR